MNSKLTAYFSHSWKTHVALNLELWKRLSRSCHLLIDRPELKIGETSPPYYISRLESLMRRSDVFVACVPAIQAAVAPGNGSDRPRRGGARARKRGRGGANATAAASPAAGDWRVRCSPYILFEIRLAERIGLPRLVIYDHGSGFVPPADPGPHAIYLASHLNEDDARVQDQDARLPLFSRVEEWLRSVQENVMPTFDARPAQCGYLVGEGRAARQVKEVIEEAVRKAGLGRPSDLSAEFDNDAALIHAMRSLKLLVVDVSRSSARGAGASAATSAPTEAVYNIAHSLVVPSIRLHAAPDETGDQHLPPILRGHPAGYQLDTVTIGKADERLFDQIERRARAAVADASPIIDYDAGVYELQQRGYRKHLVFISHDRKPDERTLVDAVCSQCGRRGIDFWEYHAAAQAGQKWRSVMDAKLKEMTHFVALLTPSYEQSPTCQEEIALAEKRKNDGVVVLPFLVDDRARPTPTVRVDGLSHQPLPRQYPPDVNARSVVNSLLSYIRR